MTYIQAMQIALEKATSQEEIDFLEYQIEAEKMHMRNMQDNNEDTEQYIMIPIYSDYPSEYGDYEIIGYHKEYV